MDPIPLPVLKLFRVIDVHNDCTVEVRSDREYGARLHRLAWVKKPKINSCNPGRLKIIFICLPKTIPDPMVLLPMIGLKYLGVDSLSHRRRRVRHGRRNYNNGFSLRKVCIDNHCSHQFQRRRGPA
ncbi:hypothetical protein K432DRAFT_473057 [Lepidopterella palustris CBS 459.81]|uniref:Uncharacterized protein n=1 Tax=Lepidopterella palustris CBS 459.81 TaxID=1314670 RepID=A0A8E2JHI6_9PEZI|nr:hypothetical protein K432DRAFT_473057 [Lepidopterella palustris CBS 459.81]